MLSTAVPPGGVELLYELVYRIGIIGVAGSVYSGIGAARGAPAAARQGTGLRLVFAVA